MKKLTPWFPAENNPPARKGWYEVRCKHNAFGSSSRIPDRLHWNGKEWLLSGAKCSFGRYCDAWRGLAVKP